MFLHFLVSATNDKLNYNPNVIALSCLNLLFKNQLLADHMIEHRLVLQNMLDLMKSLPSYVNNPLQSEKEKHY